MLWILIGSLSLLLIPPAVIAFKRAPFEGTGGRLMFAAGGLLLFLALWGINITVAAKFYPGILDLSQSSNRYITFIAVACTLPAPIIGFVGWYKLCSWLATRSLPEMPLLQTVAPMTADDIIIIALDEVGAQLESSMLASGRKVRRYGKPKAAVEHLRMHPGKAILLQAELTRASGYSVLNAIKKDNTLASVPVVFFSGRANESTFKQHQMLKTRAEQYVLGTNPDLITRALDGALTGKKRKIWD